MPSPNTNYSEIMVFAIEHRNQKLADNVTDHNPVFKYLKEKGKFKWTTGGNKILEEIDYRENGTAMFYSNYDQLDVSAQEHATAAEFEYKQAAVSVTVSGMEMIKASGQQEQIALIGSRIANAEGSLANLCSASLYDDGTGYGGKGFTGLPALLPSNPATGTYGGINRANDSWWRPIASAPGALTKANIRSEMMAVYLQLVRGDDKPDLGLADNNLFLTYHESLGDMVRFSSTDAGKYGFTSLKFLNMDIVHAGGIGGNQPTNVMYFLNTKYMYFRPVKQRWMVPLNPGKRYATNQDAEVTLIAAAGNLTCCGSRYHGRLDGN